MISDGCELDRFKELTWEAIEEWGGEPRAFTGPELSARQAG